MRNAPARGAALVEVRRLSARVDFETQRSDTRLPTKRAILSELTRDELRDNLDFFDGELLEVDDRRVTSQLIDALASPASLPEGPTR